MHYNRITSPTLCYIKKNICRYQEISKLSRETIKKFESLSEGSGHVTQLLWAKSTRLGCAGIQFQGEPGQGTKINIYCNYGAGGNIIGSPVFEEGTPCSKCENERCNPIYTGLCGTSGKYLEKLMEAEELREKVL